MGYVEVGGPVWGSNGSVLYRGPNRCDDTSGVSFTDFIEILRKVGSPPEPLGGVLGFLGLPGDYIP